MSKDPAFLFYSSDFDQGTKFLSDEQVGKYIRLMICQHQHGHLTEKQMLFICKSYDKDVFSKFENDSEGLFYNERLENEINKRINYSKSRSENRLKKKTYDETYVEHMENENENEDETVIDTVIKKGKKPKVEKNQVAEFVTLTSLEHGTLIQEYGEDITIAIIEKLDNYKGSTGRKYLSDYRAMKSWVINQVIIDTKNRSNGTPNGRAGKQPATSFAEIDAIVDRAFADKSLRDAAEGNQ